MLGIFCKVRTWSLLELIKLDVPIGATFNNLLDALHGTYCSFEGGDDLFEDAIYLDLYSNGYHSKFILHRQSDSRGRRR